MGVGFTRKPLEFSEYTIISLRSRSQCSQITTRSMELEYLSFSSRVR